MYNFYPNIDLIPIFEQLPGDAVMEELGDSGIAYLAEEGWRVIAYCEEGLTIADYYRLLSVGPHPSLEGCD